MKISQLLEARYTGGPQPAVLTVLWADTTDADVYGPFKNHQEASKFEQQIYNMFEAAGLSDIIGDFIYSSSAAVPLPPQDLVEAIEEIIQQNEQNH